VTVPGRGMRPGSTPNPQANLWRRALVTVARGELRRLLRDRKAILLAVLVPMLSYPALMYGSQRLGQISQRQIEEREVRVGVDLSALPSGLLDDVRARLAQVGSGVRFEDLDLADVVQAAARGPLDGAVRTRAEERLKDDLDGLLVAWLNGAAPVSMARDAEANGGAVLIDRDRAAHRVALVFHRASEDGLGVSAQVLGPLRQLADELESRALANGLGDDPALAFAFEARDVAPPEDSKGLALGRFLPLIAVVVLLSGGAFAALDAFAGEREQGTLETLLVQPVPTWVLAWGKFSVVLATALAAWISNVASLLITIEVGLFELPDGAAAGGLDAGRTLVAGVVFLPTVVLMAAALCFLAARARTFREGQHYLLPATLIAVALASPAMAADVKLDYLLALVPIMGPSLALRDAFAGVLAWPAALTAFAASLGWAALALSRITRTLDAERLLQAPAPKGLDPAGDAARRSLRVGLVSVAAVYIAGGALQSWDLVAGLTLTLWVLVLGLALYLGYANRRAFGGSLARALALVKSSGQTSSALSTLGWVSAGLLAGPALTQVGRFILEQQSRFLPLPSGGAAEGLMGTLAELSLPALLVLFALSPGITEELLFRGAILRGLAIDRGRVLPALFTQAALFAAMHASIHRFAITFALGVVLGALTLRSGTVFAAIALHTSYNAVAVLADRLPSVDFGHPLWWLGVLPLLVRLR